MDNKILLANVGRVYYTLILKYPDIGFFVI